MLHHNTSSGHSDLDELKTKAVTTKSPYMNQLKGVGDVERFEIVDRWKLTQCYGNRS